MGCVSSGLAGLHLKVTLPGKSFTISKNWLIVGGAIPLSWPSPKRLKHKKQKIKRHDYGAPGGSVG